MDVLNMPISVECVPCRLCAELCISVKNNVFCGDFENIPNLIFKYLNIKITMEDELPLNVCEGCRLKITDFDEYASKCETTQISLLSWAQWNQSVEQKVIKENVEIPEVKIELEEIIKSEDDDNFCDEDFLPLSKSVSRIKFKVKKKKTCISKKNKKKPIDIKSNNSNHDHDLNKFQDAEKKKEDRTQKNEKTNSIIEKMGIKLKCHICSENFQNWPRLEKHVRNLHSSKPSILCSCNKYIKSWTSVLQHFKKHVDFESCKRCPICDKKFLNESNFLRHVSRHSNDKVVKYQCEICFKVLGGKYSLKKHQDVHKTNKVKFPCDLCDKMFTSTGAVKNHTKIVHQKVKPYVCEECGHAFSSKANLKTHKVRHGEQKFYSCPHCPKKMKSVRHYQIHLDCHNGVNYKCPECPQIFNLRNTLKNHMLTHRNINRFICGFCNKGFKWKSSLVTHVNIHIGATPFACPWCPRTFSDRSNCRLHKRKHHPDELKEYETRHGIWHGKINCINKTKKTYLDVPLEHFNTTPYIHPNLDTGKSEGKN